LSPNARQIREIAVCDMPVARAIDRVDQWLSLFDGASSRVLTITASTCSSVIFRAAPGLGSSARPSRRSVTNRARHLDTVCGQIPNAAATSWLLVPSAHANTILARNARACAVFARRDHDSNV